MQENKEQKPGTDMVVPDDKTSMWDMIRYGGTSRLVSPFARDPQEEAQRRMLAHHKLWLESIQHEYPSPYTHYRIGVYIRFFNQTKYADYLLYHKQEFIDTISLCQTGRWPISMSMRDSQPHTWKMRRNGPGFCRTAWMERLT